MYFDMVLSGERYSFQLLDITDEERQRGSLKRVSWLITQIMTC